VAVELEEMLELLRTPDPVMSRVHAPRAPPAMSAKTISRALVRIIGVSRAGNPIDVVHVIGLCRGLSREVQPLQTFGPSQPEPFRSCHLIAATLKSQSGESVGSGPRARCVGRVTAWFVSKSDVVTAPSIRSSSAMPRGDLERGVDVVDREGHAMRAARGHPAQRDLYDKCCDTTAR